MGFHCRSDARCFIPPYWPIPIPIRCAPQNYKICQRGPSGKKNICWEFVFSGRSKWLWHSAPFVNKNRCLEFVFSGIIEWLQHLLHIGTSIKILPIPMFCRCGKISARYDVRYNYRLSPTYLCFNSLYLPCVWTYAVHVNSKSYIS